MQFFNLCAEIGITVNPDVRRKNVFTSQVLKRRSNVVNSRVLSVSCGVHVQCQIKLDKIFKFRNQLKNFLPRVNLSIRWWNADERLTKTTFVYLLNQNYKLDNTYQELEACFSVVKPLLFQSPK